jgi:hypothetical protein
MYYTFDSKKHLKFTIPIQFQRKFINLISKMLVQPSKMLQNFLDVYGAQPLR